MVYAVVLLIFTGLILNVVSRKYSLYKLLCTRQLSKHAVEIGEDFEIALILENSKILPVTFVQIVEKLPIQLSFKLPVDVLKTPDRKIHESTMFILPKQMIKRKFKVSIDRRGKYNFKNIDLIAGDFLGITTVEKKLECANEVIVYPKAVDLNEELTPYGSFYGDISVKRWIINDPILNLGIREYTGSEPQKSIHWPSSLRTGKLMVKNYDFTTDNRVMLVLNVECGKPAWSCIDKDKIEKCISLARTVLEELETSGIQYGFSSSVRTCETCEGNDYVSYGHGPSHFYEILELLGRINYAMSVSFEDALTNFIKNEDGSTTVVIITPSVLDDYIDNINKINSIVNKTVLISILDSNISNLNDNIITYLGK